VLSLQNEKVVPAVTLVVNVRRTVEEGTVVSSLTENERQLPTLNRIAERMRTRQETQKQEGATGKSIAQARQQIGRARLWGADKRKGVRNMPKNLRAAAAMATKMHSSVKGRSESIRQQKLGRKRGSIGNLIVAQQHFTILQNLADPSARRCRRRSQQSGALRDNNLNSKMSQTFHSWICRAV
jgi:hypothetical protein